MKKYTYLFYFLLFLNASNSQTFSGTTGIILDNGQNNDFIINVTGLSSTTLNNALGLVEVCMNISHSYDSDLNVFLIAPDGTTINLFSGIGADGDNFSTTCLNQTAPTSINTASPPFNGTFKPQETLGNINNQQNGNGIWKLRIRDTYPQDEGTVNSWNITFANNAQTPFVFTSSNLPIVIINTAGQEIQDEPSINATMKIIFNSQDAINTITDTPNNYNGNILIEYRGNYSQSLPQKPFKIETIDANNAELNTSLLEMPEEHDWVLIANYNDKVFVRNSMAYSIFTNMGHYATRHKYCEVVLNGNYQGVYLLMESIKRDSNRVNIAKLDPDENSGINITGGYILKNDYWNSQDSWLLNYHPIDHPEMDVNLVYEYPKPQNISPQQQSYIQTFINNFETALYSPNFASTTSGYSSFIDTESFIDYLIVNELARNNDGFKKSCFFNKDKDSQTTTAKLKAGPVWDFDWAWKNINECSIFAANDGSGWAHKINDCGPDVNSTGWYVRLLQDPNFQDALHCRWNYFRTNILSYQAITQYIDATALYLQQAQQRHFEKWGNLGVNTGTPEMEQDPATFEEQIIKFKNWIALRLAWLDENMPGNTNNCSLYLSENQKQAIKIYPNPALDYFAISLPKELQETPINLTISDLLGRTIKKITLPNTATTISTANLEKGTYLILITANNNSFSTKLIVQ
jgi:subtilisin-like proprotein convertase family protein